ncbi:MAG: glycosyltransferase family 4 protein [Butyrivibrio sp.]
MFKLGFKKHYKVVHVNNELGNRLIGGAGTYINELYKYRGNDTGFIYINMGGHFEDFDSEDYPAGGDIAIVHTDEAEKLSEIDCDILVVQFYEFASFINEEVLRNKKLVYVIHSVPTPEPPPSWDAFGGNEQVRQKFEYLCNHADMLVCVSFAEKNKLEKIYPQYAYKIRVVHNGITFDSLPKFNENYKKSRRIFGYIGRTDYRKGILECLKAIRNTDAELHLACPKNDSLYIEKILLYIEAANMYDRVQFHGWCVGKRKENFLNSLDALIVPSLYEPFGYVVLEGILHGLPVISSNNGGPEEILQGYRYTYDPYSDNGLKDTIEMFRNDSDTVINGQQQILMDNLTRFHARDMAANYEKLWEELLNG